MRAAGLMILAACGESTPMTPTDAPPPIPPASSPSEVTPSIMADADGAWLGFGADFAAPGGLPPDATVTATFRNMALDLTRTTATRFNFENTFPTPIAEGESLTITLSIGQQAATATLTIPAFTIDSVTGTFCNTTTDPLVVTWSPVTGDAMTWDVAGGSPMGSCDYIGAIPPDRTVPDTGTFTLRYCIVASGPGCVTGYSLSRVRSGSEQGFAPGGSITARARGPWWP